LVRASTKISDQVTSLPRHSASHPEAAARRTERARAGGDAGVSARDPAISGELPPPPPTSFLADGDGVDGAVTVQELRIFYSDETTNLLETSIESSRRCGTHPRGLEHRFRPQI
jgi:hypothetical protein